MAYWWMDDGGKLDDSDNQGKGTETGNVVFNTQGFTENEENEMSDQLKDKFG